MAIQTYSQLQAAIGRWLKRTNLADSAADFITLAEARLNRNLNVRQMRTWYTVTPITPFVTLPGDYNRAVKVTYGDHDLDFRAEQLASPLLNLVGSGREFTLTGNRLWILGPVDGQRKLTLHYLQNIEPLSDTNTSNWLLEDAPDIYLYASLLEAEPYIKNDERIAVWKDALATALADIHANDQEARISGSALAMKAG